MSISKISVKRPVTAFMVVIIAILFGFISITQLKTDLLPNMNLPYAAVITVYDGAGSEEVENLITKPIEASMGTVSGIKEIKSRSSNGASLVFLQFETSVDIDLAAVDIREKVDLVKRNLPDDANDPLILKVDINSMSSLYLSVTSDNMTMAQLNDVIENDIIDRLERLEGVASVGTSGGLEREIKITLKQDKLRGYGISETTVAGLLKGENNNTPVGSIKMGDKNLAVRVKGEFKSLEEVKNLPIPLTTGAVIHLDDIAEVEEVFKESSSSSYTNGKESIRISVQKQSNANTVEVSEKTLNEIEKIKAEHQDLDFIVITDPAEYINNAISNVTSTLIKGGLLAVLVLYVFLRNVRSTLVVGLSMPLSVITTFVFMYFAGINFNMMSLGGLTLGIGMLVDNSIVVLENIYKKLEEGEERKFAAIEGAREVSMSMVASTLTTVAVFVPVIFVGGTIGELFRDLALTIVFSLTASLLVALSFVPMASSIILSVETTGTVHKRHNLFTRIMDAIGNAIKFCEIRYKIILDRALKHRYTTIIVVIVFVFTTGYLFRFVGFDLMPATDEGNVSVSISLPKGSELEKTELIADKVIYAVENIEHINYIETSSYSIGGGGTLGLLTGSGEDSATLMLKLVDRKDRKHVKTSDIANEIREAVKDVAGADIEVSTSSSLGTYSSGGLEVLIKGDELDKLDEIANDIVAMVETIPNTSEVKTSIEDVTPQSTIKIKRDKAAAYGITGSTVSSTIRTAVTGNTATTYKIDGDEYDIRIVQDSDKINFITDVENLLIPTAMGTSIPLYEIATIEDDPTPVTITRENQQKYVSVTGNITDVDLGTINSQISEKMKDYIMPTGYTWEFGGTTERMNDAFTSLGFALIVAILLVYMVMAAEFEAFGYPLIVMLSMPIAMTGGILGLFLTGESLSVTACLGFIMLAGVVVNNAIVLIDYINLLRDEREMELFEAITTGGASRFRPIFMTTLTTVLGLLPMMLSKQDGSEMMTGLAVVVVFGLTLSTLVTLIFVPVVYMMFAKRQVKSRERKRLKKERKELKKERKELKKA